MSLRSPQEPENFPVGTGGSRSVIPAKAGIHGYSPSPRLDTRLRQYDGPRPLWTDPKHIFKGVHERHEVRTRALKTFSLLFVIFASCVVILFCAATASRAATTLRFVTWRPEVPRVWDEAIAEFERDNPGVRVVREIGPQSSTQFHDLITQKLKNRDSSLDVFIMDVIWPAEFASAGWVWPLDSVFDSTEQQKFLRPPLAANRYGGQIFGVPLFIDAGLLYYRRDLLEKYSFAPPKSWPELVEQAKTILQRERDPQLSGYSA